MSLSVEQVCEVHNLLIDWFSDSEDPISPPGVRDLNLLESAVARPDQTSAGDDLYPTPFDKAAALFHSLINNHPFYNGNKRVALVCSQVMLDENSYWLEGITDEEMFEFTRQTAAHELVPDRKDELQVIAKLFENVSRKTQRGEHPLKFQALKEALGRFGYDLGPPVGMFVNISKDRKVVETIKKEGIQGFRPYHTHYIRELRKRLRLMPEHGVDSTLFYGGKGVYEVASEFIEIRLEVIKRLAKT